MMTPRPIVKEPSTAKTWLWEYRGWGIMPCWEEGNGAVALGGSKSIANNRLAILPPHEIVEYRKLVKDEVSDKYRMALLWAVYDTAPTLRNAAKLVDASITEACAACGGSGVIQGIGNRESVCDCRPKR